MASALHHITWEASKSHGGWNRSTLPHTTYQPTSRTTERSYLSTDPWNPLNANANFSSPNLSFKSKRPFNIRLPVAACSRPSVYATSKLIELHSKGCATIRDQLTPGIEMRSVKDHLCLNGHLLNDYPERNLRVSKEKHPRRYCAKVL